MKFSWWKILCVALLAFTFTAGLLIPLGPGILGDGVTPAVLSSAAPGQLNVRTYNTLFVRDTGRIVARLRVSDDRAVCARSVRVANDNELDIAFDIPPIGELGDSSRFGPGMASPFPVLEIYGPSSGLATQERAVVLRKSADGYTDTAALCEATPFPRGPRMAFPFINLNEESNRNLFFHVPMWFGMTLLMLASMVFSVRQLRVPSARNDRWARSLAVAGTLFGVLGLITGSIWARFTWGTWWTVHEVKLNAAAAAVLVYLAYFVLRGAIEDEAAKARISAVYSIFAFVMLIVLTFVIPRMAPESLHPGGKGNVVFSQYDLDNTMRMVFYPAVIGWTLLGVWIAELNARLERIQEAVSEFPSDR
jgi:heme exporter protein C